MDKAKTLTSDQRNRSYTKVIDGKTYVVNLHFAATGETFEQKYERLLRQSILDQLNSQK